MNGWKVLTFFIYCEEVNYPSRIHSGLQSQLQDSQGSKKKKKKKTLVSKSQKKILVSYLEFYQTDKLIEKCALVNCYCEL